MDLMFMAKIISNVVYELVFLSIYNFIKNRSQENLNHLVKVGFCTISIYFIHKYEPKNSLTLRPKNGKNCFLNKQLESNFFFETGFPSGHAAMTTLFCAYSIKNNLANIPLVIFNIFLIIIMSWARWYSNCHTITQIVAGIFYGLFLTVI